MKTKNRRILSIFFSLIFMFAKAFAQEQPNIILVIADDVSAEDIGIYGNKDIHTPNIDRVAKSGVRFENAFVTSSSCSPSRVSLLTGRYPHNTGAAELHTHVSAVLTYFPEQLKMSGYFTAQAGKHHEGPSAARAYDKQIKGEELNGNGGQDYWIELLQSRPKNKPFFFWLATFDAHRSWGADHFKEIELQDENKIAVPEMLADTEKTRRDLASYYNEIRRLDYYIGKLYNELEIQGILDNTVIIFMSDNGRAFPGSKTRLYNRGVKTPLLVSWPGKIVRNQVSKSLVSSIDIGPTILEFANIIPAPSIQGMSFYHVLHKPEKKFRNYIFAEHNWHDFKAYERSIRTADFLYIKNELSQYDAQGALDVNQSPSAFDLRSLKMTGAINDFQNDYFLEPRPKEEFYKVKTDSLQKVNLIDHPLYKRQLNKLKRVLVKWQKKTADTMPKHVTEDWFSRETGQRTHYHLTRGEMPGTAKNAVTNNNRGPF